MRRDDGGKRRNGLVEDATVESELGGAGRMSEGDEADRSTVDSTLTTDRALSLLSDFRRRRLLIALVDRKPEPELDVDPEALKREFVRTRDTPRLSPADVDRVVISIHHNHLPRLVECDVLQWNEWDDTVEPGPAFDAIEPFIEALDHDRAELPSDRTRVREVDEK